MTTPPGPLPPAVVEAFRCPACRAKVEPVAAGVRCTAGHVSPWRDGYLDATALPAAGPDAQPAGAEHDAVQRTLESFGYEWTRFAAVQPEDEVFWRRYFADVDLEGLAGRLALDAGCGKGRFSRFTAPHVGALVALDGSDAVVAAAANLADVPGAVVVRADVREMPFERSSFGFVSCLGVLHHLPDPKAGFDELVDLLSPGGLLLIYVYSRPEEPGIRAAGLRAAAALRRVTVRLPHRVLRPLCWPLALGLYAVFVAPGAVGARHGWKRLAGLPLATYRGQPLRSLWLDTFDRLSAPLEVRYTADELRAWFEDQGVELLAVRSDPDLAGLVALGRR